MDKFFSLRRLLWIDGTAALVVSATILIFSSRLSVFFNMPEILLQILANIGLMFAAYSLNLARQVTHPRRLVYLLIFANAAYALLALCVAVYYFKSATGYGTAYFLAEVILIGLLAFFEWRKIKE